MPARSFRWSLVFWIAAAVAFVVLFNFEHSLPRIMGFSMPDVIAAGIVLAIWIVALVVTLKKWKTGAKGS